MHCSRELWVHGVPEYYRGLSLMLVRNAASNVMFFGLRGPIRDILHTTDKQMGWGGEVTANFVSGESKCVIPDCNFGTGKVQLFSIDLS